MLGVNADMLRQHVSILFPGKRTEPANFKRPQVHCQICEEALGERTAVVDEVSQNMQYWQSDEARVRLNDSAHVKPFLH